MSSWQQRDKSQDIMSQKQSDATLGYERVYDTDSGKIYKATNGFTDVYTGNRFKPVTDDNMYAEPVSGYIEKRGWCRFVGLPCSCDFDYATRPSSRRRSMMLMPYSVLIRLSRYQTM